MPETDANAPATALMVAAGIAALAAAAGGSAAGGADTELKPWVCAAAGTGGWATTGPWTTGRSGTGAAETELKPCA